MLAVNWPPQAPAPGLAHVLELVQLLVGHLARGVGADRLEHVLDRHVLAAPPAGRDRAAVEHQRGDVEPRHRHHAAGNRLVAARQRDERVELVAARRQLDRVGDHLAADQRGLHPLGPHRDPVRDRDRVELQRRAAGGAHALLDSLGEPAQVEVARHRLDPGVGDADRRLRERPRRRSRSPSCTRARRRGRGRRRPRSSAGAARVEPLTRRSASVPAVRASAMPLAGARAPPTPQRRRSRRTWAGRPGGRGGACWRRAISPCSSPCRAIHLASTSSASGSRAPAAGSLAIGETRRSTRSAARRPGVEGDDRAVRIDQVAVRRSASRLGGRSTRMKPSSRTSRSHPGPTTERISSRARRSARRSRPGSTAAPRGAACRPRDGASEQPRDRRAPMTTASSRQQRPSVLTRRDRYAPGSPGRSAARGRREEDHALGVARNLGEVADHRGLAAPARAGGRHRRPHPWSSWRRNSSIRRSSSSASSGSPSASRTSP